MPLRRNILIFHQGALGDFVVTWPLALGLARVFAQSRVFYVTSSQKGALAERVLRVESVDVEGGWYQLFSQEPKLPDPAMRLIQGARWIISFVAGAENAWLQNVRRLAPEATLVCLSTAPGDQFEGHVTTHLLAQLASWPVLAAAMDQMLKAITARGIGIPAGNPGGPVVLHPGAGSGKKCWPPERYLELARLLNSSGRAVEVVLGEVEMERWPAAQVKAFENVAVARRTATLLELLDRIAAASAFVGNDSGPGHLAGILGVPTISIFGPGDPQSWRPVGPKVQVVCGEWDVIDPTGIIRLMQNR
ncbi:MAG TPA: glycosyltransferase family 9 protein [Tepidisphaeraceae bacterium]|nr:glycosyltransferase family 9 protein [Tepidisphaeraceae bacterium]